MLNEIMIVFYVTALLIPIGAIIYTFIHRNDKEYTEVDVFINNSDDEYWFY